MQMSDIKRANANAGNHWFDPDTLRFFSSRVSEMVYGAWRSGGGDKPGGKFEPLGQYFVTSERFDYTWPRLYTVRRFEPSTSEVATAPNHEFQQYASYSGAQKAAKRAAKREQEES